MPLIAGCSYGWFDAQYFREIELAISRSNVSPSVARQLSSTLLGAMSTEHQLRHALSETAKVVASVTVVRASTATDPSLARQIAQMTIIQLNAIAAEAD
jgi:hypothetical protein